MENPGTVQQEIAKLEQQLAEKRASLEQQAAETKQEVPHDKDIVRQVVGERIQSRLEESRILDSQSESGHAPAYQPAPKKQDDASTSYNDPQLAPKVQELVNVAFTKGIDEAVRSVVQSGNPALVDAFHDVLVDQLYDMLVERKKLEPVK